MPGSDVSIRMCHMCLHVHFIEQAMPVWPHQPKSKRIHRTKANPPHRAAVLPLVTSCGEAEFVLFTEISPEIHHTSPEYHHNFSGISPDSCRSIESEHLKRGGNRNSPLILHTPHQIVVQTRSFFAARRPTYGWPADSLLVLLMIYLYYLH